MIQATVIFEQNWNAIHARNPDGSRKYRYILNEGSSRSSKTISLIDCYDLYARENAGKRLTVWRDTKTDCKKTVLVDMLKRLKKTNRYLVGHDYNKTESIFTYSEDSTVEIHGTDDEETVHGLTQDAAWLNEPYKISKETFDQIDQRTSDFIFLDLNPKKKHWADDLKKDPRTLVIHSTFRHNPFCPPEEKIKILSYQPVSMCKLVLDEVLSKEEALAYDLINNPANYEPKLIKELTRCRENEDKRSANEFNWCVYGLGIKAEKPNRIYSWAPISYEKYKAIEATRYIGNDWGSVDPWAIVEAKYYDGCLYLHQLNYKSENQLRQTMQHTELMQVQAEDAGQQDGIGIVSWRYNQLQIDKNLVVICDTNRPLKIAALRRAGWSRATGAVSKVIKDGIDLLNNLKVYYTDCSEDLEYEQENYSREVDRYGIVLEEPEDANNHCMDAARYIALYLQATGVIKII